MAKQKIDTYIFQPGIPLSGNRYPNAYELIKNNIELQLKAGAEIVMIFDTDAKSISNEEDYKNYSDYLFKEIITKFPKKIGY